MAPAGLRVRAPRLTLDKQVSPDSGVQAGSELLYTITVDLLEYFPPPKASAIGTPTGSAAGKGSNGAKPGGDPIADAQQAEIAKLLAQAQDPGQPNHQDGFH